MGETVRKLFGKVTFVMLCSFNLLANDFSFEERDRRGWLFMLSKKVVLLEVIEKSLPGKTRETN